MCVGEFFSEFAFNEVSNCWDTTEGVIMSLYIHSLVCRLIDNCLHYHFLSMLANRRARPGCTALGLHNSSPFVCVYIHVYMYVCVCVCVCVYLDQKML